MIYKSNRSKRNRYSVITEMESSNNSLKIYAFNARERRNDRQSGGAKYNAGGVYCLECREKNLFTLENNTHYRILLEILITTYVKTVNHIQSNAQLWQFFRQRTIVGMLLRAVQQLLNRE